MIFLSYYFIIIIGFIFIYKYNLFICTLYRMAFMHISKEVFSRAYCSSLLKICFTSYRVYSLYCSNFSFDFFVRFGSFSWQFYCFLRIWILVNSLQFWASFFIWTNLWPPCSWRISRCSFFYGYSFYWVFYSYYVSCYGYCYSMIFYKYIFYFIFILFNYRNYD